MKLFSTNTVEGFFEHYVHLKRPSEIQTDNDIFFFRDHHMPLWEKAPRGGTLMIKMGRQHEKLDLSWEKLMLMCVGEALADFNVIGVACSLRRNNCALLEVWFQKVEGNTKNCTLEIS